MIREVSKVSNQMGCLLTEEDDRHLDQRRNSLQELYKGHAGVSVILYTVHTDL